jgi:hypothetical protein
VFLIALLTIIPAMGSINKATQNTPITIHLTSEEYVTIDFIDTTDFIPIKKEITISKTEWYTIRKELREIRTSEISIEESLTAQLTIFKNHNLISNDITIETLQNKLTEKSKTHSLPAAFHKMKTSPIINNSVFNAMCAIDFELINGSTAVFGLNTFVNIVGFDIISLHKGYAVDGIDTKGLFSKATPPGEYVGFMFGFLGYWLGEKIIAGVYSNVTCAGFSVITVWLPIPLFP